MAHLQKDGTLCHLMRHCVGGEAEIPKRGVKMASEWLPPSALCGLALPGKFCEGVYLRQPEVQVPVQEVRQILPSTCAAAVASLLCRESNLTLKNSAAQWQGNYCLRHAIPGVGTGRDSSVDPWTYRNLK